MYNQKVLHSSKTKKKRILLINTGYEKKKFILQRIKKLGYELFVMQQNKPLWAQKYVDKWILTDNNNHEQALKDVTIFFKENPVDGVITFWEDDILLTSKIVSEFGFKGIPYNIAKNVRNKFAFREFSLTHNIPTPRYARISSFPDLQVIKKILTFPIVLKPEFGSLNALVTKVQKPEDLEQSYKTMLFHLSNNKNIDITVLHDGTNFFAEEYIDGEEVDIDMLIQNGKVKFSVVSDNYDKTEGMYFIDKGQATPSSLPLPFQHDLKAMTESVLEKLNILDGCIHFEAKYTKKGPIPIEVNLRMGGDYVHSYIRSAWDVDMVEYAAKIAIGEYFTIKQRDYPHKYVIGWDIHPEESGVVSEFTVDPALEKKDYFEDMSVHKTIGDKVFMPPDGNDSASWLTISGANPLDAKDNLNEALDLIDLKIVEFDEDSSIGKTSRENNFSSLFYTEGVNHEDKLKKITSLRVEDLKQLSLGILYETTKNAQNDIALHSSGMIEDIYETLLSAGYNVVKIPVTDIRSFNKTILQHDIDLAIPIVRDLPNQSPIMFNVCNILTALDIPYVGSDNYPSTVAEDTITFKKLLDYHEIPTPSWDYVRMLGDSVSEELLYPVIVKPSQQTASMGITDKSVVEQAKDLQPYIDKTLKTYKSPVLVEEYVSGDEYAVYIIGSIVGQRQVLPLVRTMFSKNDKPGNRQLYTFARRLQNNKDSSNIEVPAKRLSKKIETLLTEIAIDTYTIVRCKDYGMVKIRMDKEGSPYVLGIDLWPDISKDAVFTRLAKVSNVKYLQLLESILRAAIETYQQ